MRQLVPYYSFLVPALVTRYPWLRSLPEAEQLHFARAYASALTRAHAERSDRPLAILLAQWEYTASVHADPALLAAMLRPIVPDEATGKPVEVPPRPLDA